MVMGMMSIGKEHAMSIGHDIESETDNQISYEGRILLRAGSMS